MADASSSEEQAKSFSWFCERSADARFMLRGFPEEPCV